MQNSTGTSEEKKNLKRLFSFAGKYKILITLSLIFSGFSAIITLLPFICIYFAAGEVLRVFPNISLIDIDRLTMFGWYAVIFAVAGFFIYFAALMLSHIAAFHVERNMKSKLMHHLTKLPMGFHTQNSSGKLRKIIDENTASTEAFLAHQLPDLAGAAVSAIAIIGMLLFFDWRLGVLSLLTILIGFAIQMRMIQTSSKEWIKKYQDAQEDMNKEAVEYVRGISVLKVFGRTVHSCKTFKDAILSYRDYATKYCLSWKTPYTVFLTAINGTFFLLIPAAILLIGSASNYTEFLLNFIFYVIFTPACAMMLMKIMYMSSYKLIAIEATQRIDSILLEKPLPKSTNPKTPEGNKIKFENVSFTYPNAQRKALNGISFEIPEGEVTALVGPSGGGKTTIANLIPRFWDVESGKISLGKADVKDIDPKILMNRVSFVFQDAKLFKDSLRNNILAARPEASEEELLNAVKAAQAEDIIAKFPNGLDTIIGTKGVYLSGGESQRIVLARAILKDAPVIILDEATAFADPENEYKIQLAFSELIRNKTVLMIAHRLSTIRNAKQILVVEDGRISETGSHDELISMNGVYSQLWNEYQRSISWGLGREGGSYVS